MSYTSKSIANLKDQINILDVVSGAITLKKTGASYKGVCPFHKEKTPSFNVSESRQMFYCFGCQASGDVIEFVKRFYNLEFNDAVEKLSREYGVEMEETQGYGEDLDKYYRINKDAAEYFYKAFTEKANIGYTYMKNRGIDPKYLKKFGIGYADESWDGLYQFLKSKGYEEKEMMELGLISKSKDRYYDKFRKRVIFPIISTRGKVIGFGGRAIDPEDNPKYLNSQESKVFQKKNNIYGLNLSRSEVNKQGYIILVEGYMDVISLYQAGIENIGASLGTALTEQQARMIKRYAKKVILCYDSDNAGRQAALRGMEILKAQDLDVRVTHVTGGKDPDEFIKTNGKEAFQNIIDNAMYYGDYKIMNAVTDFNLDDHNERIRAIKKIAEILYPMTPGERDEYAGNAAKIFNISKTVLLEETQNLKENKADRKGRGVKSEDDLEKKIQDELSSVEMELLGLILKNEEYISKAKDNSELFGSDKSKRIFSAIKENLSNDGILDTGKLLDELNDEDRKDLYSVMEKVVISGDEEKIFKDILKKYKLNQTKSEIERLNDMLKYAGKDEIEESEIKALMERINELQTEIVNIKAEEE